MSAAKKDLDYLNVLRALTEIPFNIGRKLLIDFLQGSYDHESIKRNSLDKLEAFGSMAYDKDELNDIIESLIMNGMVQYATVKENKFWKVLAATQKGIEEIKNPSLYKRKLGFSFRVHETKISEEDKKIFSAFGHFLDNYNENQKKAIVSNKEKILCVAGAGSGKTSVLTKRVEFLVKFKSADPEKILAITFTRKARAEMKSRISNSPYCEGVCVETFNSFCEKVLNKYNNLAYGRPVRVIGYGDKIRLVRLALSSINISMENAIERYFTSRQRNEKTREELANVLMNDCFFILDYCKSKDMGIQDFSLNAAREEEIKSAKMVCQICRFIDSQMKNMGLRDYSDQLIDAIRIFREHKETIPYFEHVLIDEYQDVNSTQDQLIELLNPKNIFCVGDPRQSIFGWRGSNVKYILNFEDKYPECEIITLTKNYRSSTHIVDLINKSIKNMNLPDLEGLIKAEKHIKLLKFENEDDEHEFVIQRILASDIPKNEVFVLARTNRQLSELSNRMKVIGIKHIVKSDEMNASHVASDEEVTLATIHSIKGMEARMVFVIGCTSNNFPCRASEHPVIDLVKMDDYDKEEEERRLFYVALSRAKEKLYLSYHGNGITAFINADMKQIIDEQKAELKPLKTSIYNISNNASGNILKMLKDWRRNICQSSNIPPYMVMHDRTLLEVAQKKPASVEELQEIYGLGPTKIMKYGKDIIRIVNG